MTRANPQDTGMEGAESRVQVRQIRMRQKAEPKSTYATRFLSCIR